MNYLIMILALLSFFNPLFRSSNDDEICIESKMGGKANSQSATMLEKKYGLHRVGFGMKVDDKVEGLYLTFDYYGEQKDINEARKLLYSVVQDHLNNILSNDEFKPYRADPFTYDNIKISLFFHTPDSYYVYHPAISSASFYRNYTVLFITDGPGRHFKPVAEIEESGQQFFDIVEGRVPAPVYKELQVGDS